MITALKFFAHKKILHNKLQHNMSGIYNGYFLLSKHFLRCWMVNKYMLFRVFTTEHFTLKKNTDRFFPQFTHSLIVFVTWRKSMNQPGAILCGGRPLVKTTVSLLHSQPIQLMLSIFLLTELVLVKLKSL